MMYVREAASLLAVASFSMYGAQDTRRGVQLKCGNQTQHNGNAWECNLLNMTTLSGKGRS